MSWLNVCVWCVAYAGVCANAHVCLRIGVAMYAVAFARSTMYDPHAQVISISQIALSHTEPMPADASDDGSDDDEDDGVPVLFQQCPQPLQC